MRVRCQRGGRVRRRHRDSLARRDRPTVGGDAGARGGWPRSTRSTPPGCASGSRAAGGSTPSSATRPGTTTTSISRSTRPTTASTGPSPRSPRLGYAPGLDDLPVRLVVATADDRRVDLHPIRFRADGDAFQRGPRPRVPVPGRRLHGRPHRRPRRRRVSAPRVQREFHSALRAAAGRPPRPRADSMRSRRTRPGVVDGERHPGRGEDTVAAVSRPGAGPAMHVEGDALQRLIRSGGRWAHAGAVDRGAPPAAGADARGRPLADAVPPRRLRCRCSTTST